MSDILDMGATYVLTIHNLIISSDVIMSVPNNSKPNGQIYFINRSQAKMLFRAPELSRFIISFTDDDGNLLNFNGISSFFT